MSTDRMDTSSATAADRESNMRVIAFANADKAMAGMGELHESLGGTGGHTKTGRQRAIGNYNFLFDSTTGEILQFYTGQDPLDDQSVRAKFASEQRDVRQGYVRIAYDFSLMTSGTLPVNRLEEVTDIACAHGSVTNSVATIFDLTKQEMNKRFWELDEKFRAALKPKTEQ